MGKTKRVKDRQAERRGTDCTNASDAGLSTQIQTNLVQSFLSISTQSFQMILFFSRDYFSSLPTHPAVCLSENSFSRLTTSHLYSDIILVHRFIFFPFFFLYSFEILPILHFRPVLVSFYFFFSAALHNRINTSTFVSKLSIVGRTENELIFFFVCFSLDSVSAAVAWLSCIRWG